MGRHSKPEKGFSFGDNPTGTSQEGTGPVRDRYTNEALADAWRIDEAYEKKNEEE